MVELSQTGIGTFWRHMRAGRRYGYPMCCVLYFSLEHALGLSCFGSALHRGCVKVGTSTYVPCPRCWSHDRRVQPSRSVGAWCLRPWEAEALHEERFPAEAQAA
jgi:hypothetical protein